LTAEPLPSIQKHIQPLLLDRNTPVPDSHLSLIGYAKLMPYLVSIGCPPEINIDRIEDPRHFRR
jgi:hypothetical protein